jgi:predicted RNA-binding Zn-ribbon protein involved in translation (DUF1610 family)
MELENNRIGKYRLETRPERLKRLQFEMSKEVINATGINIVTCGDCGSTLLHRLTDQEIECPDCGFISEPCDFPDLLT